MSCTNVDFLSPHHAPNQLENILPLWEPKYILPAFFSFHSHSRKKKNMLVLPTEIILKFTAYLPLTSIFSLLQTNRHFYMVITQNEHSISLSLIHRDFPTLLPIRTTAPKGLRLYKHLSNEDHIRSVTVPFLYELYKAKTKIVRRKSISSAFSRRSSLTPITPILYTTFEIARADLLGLGSGPTDATIRFTDQVLLLYDFIAAFKFGGGLINPAIDSNGLQKNILASYTTEQLADLDLIVSYIRRLFIDKLRGTKIIDAHLSYLIASGLEVVEKVLNASEEKVMKVIEDEGVGRVEAWVRWPVNECLRERGRTKEIVAI